MTAIVNRTPDSFYDRGAAWDPSAAVVPSTPLLVPSTPLLVASTPLLARSSRGRRGEAWQVLAGALPEPFAPRLLPSSAPYGVGYRVALRYSPEGYGPDVA